MVEAVLESTIQDVHLATGGLVITAGIHMTPNGVVVRPCGKRVRLIGSGDEVSATKEAVEEFLGEEVNITLCVENPAWNLDYVE